MVPVLLFQALIVDAAVETFRGGSSVRWTVVLIAAACVIANVTLWRRLTHQVKLAISTSAFSAMLAITAWQPGGLNEGVRLLGLSTSTVLSLALVSGISVAAIVITIEARLPRAMRWLAAVVGAYGVIAFAQGIVIGVPFQTQLTGASFWRPLPMFLQGAFVGGLVMLPGALVIATVRAGTRQPPEGTRLRALHQLIVLAAALSLVIAALPLRFRPGAAGGGAAGTPPTNMDAATRVALLDNSLRAIEDGDRESPRDRWDPDYVVQQLGRDPQRIFAWVRDNTFWIPYRGTLRGPVGVLMDRQGNSLDRALLLATLLEKTGHTVRLAHGELTRDQANELLPALMTQRAIAAQAPSAESQPTSNNQGSIQAAASQYHLDAGDVVRSLASRAAAVSKIYAQLHTRVSEQSQRLLAAVGKPELVPAWRKRVDAAADACRDHWWVQTQDGDTWTDLDLLSPAQTPNAALITSDSTRSLSGLDASLHHELEVRIVAEHSEAGGLKEERILAHTVRPSELVGDVLVLQFWPSAWPTELAADPNARFGFRAAALQQTDWTAVLVSDRNVLARASLAATGAAPLQSGNPFGGLGRGIAENSRSTLNRDSAQLTAVWIEYQFHTPDGPPRTVRRAVFDLLGPAARAAGSRSPLHLTEADRLSRSLALMMRTEMLPMAAALAPEFGVHVGARSVLANRKLLRTMAGPDVPLEAPQMEDLMANTAPGVSALFAIAIGRFALASPAVFLDHTNLLTRHQYPTALSDGIHFIDAVDIVSNEVGVDLTEVDGFAARVAQGVLDTNAEALLRETPWSASNTAEAFSTSHDWVTLLPSNRAELEKAQVSADIRRSISADLDSGYAVVFPRAHQRASELDGIGWWRINPTGDTLGVGASGWGQDLAEDFAQHVLWRYAKDFAFQYAFCQAIPQIAGNVVELLQQYRDQLPRWLPPLAQSKDPWTVAKESHRGCLIGAMIGTGVTATLPFLIAIWRLSGRGLVSLASRGASAAESGANPLAKTLPAFKGQPSGNPLANTEPGVNPSPMGPPRGSPPPGEPMGPPRGSPPPGQGPLGPPRGSPPPGQGPLGPPRGSPPPGEAPSTLSPKGPAPPGDGPYQSTALPDLEKMPEGHSLFPKLAGESGDAIGLYRQANSASTSAYNTARAAGAGNDAARQASWDAYWAYLRQGRGAQPIIGRETFVRPGTMELQAGAGGFSGPGGVK